MQERSFLANEYFNIKKTLQGFALITAIILSIVAPNASSTLALASNKISKPNSVYATDSNQASSVALQVDKPSISINKGQTAHYSVSIDRSNFDNSVELGLTQLTNAPTPGITFVYSKKSTTEDKVTLDIITTDQTPVGSYSFVVTGKASGITIKDSNKITLAVNADQQDFSLLLSPNSLTVRPSETAKFIITGDSQTLDGVSLSVTGLPANVSSNFTTQTKSSILSVVTNSNTPTGTYSITVTGVRGNFTHKTSATLIVQDVTKAIVLQVNQPTMSIFQGQPVTIPVSIKRTNFTDPVELGLVSSNNTTIPGLTFSYSPNPTTDAATNLSITTTTNIPTGTYTLFVTGKASGLTIANSNPITLFVNAPTSQDFSLSLSPSTLTVKPGATATFTLNRNNIGGSFSNIALSINGVPAGITASLPNNNNFPLPLSLTTSNNTALGNYTITVTGTRGGFTRTTTATLVVQNINTTQSVKLQVNQQSLTVTQGQTATYSVGLNRVNFPSLVTLTLTSLTSSTVPGLTVSYSQNPTSGNGVSLNLVTTNNTPAGTYNFVLTGKAVGLIVPDSNMFSLVVKSPVVTQPDFNLTLSPSSLTVKPGETANFALNRNDLGGFSSNVSVNVSGIPSNSINGLPSTFSFPVTLPIITNGDTPAGTYTITVTGVGGGLTRTAAATLKVEGANKSVTLQSNQTSTTITQGQSASYPISVNRSNFTDSIELGLKVLSGSTIPGLTFGYSQNPTSGNTVSLNLSTTNITPAGSYNFVVTGKAAGLTIADSNVLTLVVNSTTQSDFSLSLAPSSITVKPGETANYTLNRTSVGGFSGNVVLSINGLPSGATSNISSSSDSTITVPVVTTNNTPQGTYTLTITGVSGNITRTASATLVVEPVKPMISTVGYVKPFLTINGTNFGTDLKVFVNNKDVSNFIRTASATLVDLKGNKKKLGLKTGSNQIKVISNGIESNTVLVSSFSNEAVVFMGEEVINTNADDYFTNRTPKAFDSTDEDSINSLEKSNKQETFGTREN